MNTHLEVSPLVVKYKNGSSGSFLSVDVGSDSWEPFSRASSFSEISVSAERGSLIEALSSKSQSATSSLSRYSSQPIKPEK